MTNTEESRRPSRISVPPHAHPFSRLVFAEMRRQNVSYAELEWRSGILGTTVKEWRVSKTPSLQSIQATLGALGFGVAPYPRIETLPPHVREMAEELGQHFFADEHALAAAVAATISFPGARSNGDEPAPRLSYRTPHWRDAA